MTREEFINWFDDKFALTKNDIYEIGQLYDEVTKSQWISVDVELPPKQPNREQSKNVLVRTNSGRTKIEYYDYGNDVIKEWWKYNITHWMPLPQPPSPKDVAESPSGREIEIVTPYE